MSEKRSPSALKSVLVWIVIFVISILLWQTFSPSDPPPWKDHQALRDDLRDNRVVSLLFTNEANVVTLTDGTRYSVGPIDDEELWNAVGEAGVEIDWEEENDTLWNILAILVPVVLVVGLFFWLLKRQAGASATNILSLRKNPARILEQDSTVKFADVGGCTDAKAKLGDLVAFLRDPEPWTRVGARVPRGVLLEGPPGCGKTLLARAVAGETDATFFIISASEFVEMFVGVGAARVRDLFDAAAKKAPAVVFIDELDAVGRRRGSGIGASHDEREQTLNQLLVCLDGVEREARIVVIAATNRSDVLDRALLRPGRFDRRVEVPTLDLEARREVLAIHARGKLVDDSLDLAAFAEKTSGLNGASLEMLLNEAALSAARRSVQEGTEAPIGQQDLLRALEDAKSSGRSYDQVDTVLLESASQLAEPVGAAHVRLVQDSGAELEGDIVWVDATFVKLRLQNGGSRIIAKQKIRELETLAGTEASAREDVRPDPWVGRSTDLV